MQVLPYTTDWLSRRFTKACAQRMFVGNNRAIVLGRNLHRSLCVLELTYSLVSARLEGAMDTKLYLTIGAVAAILYALAFLLFPVNASLFFSDFAEARAVLYLRFCGAAILAWGLIVWFARDFQGWYAVRSVLIASVVGLAINIIITVWATVTGWLNGHAWGSTAVLVLLLVGAAYQLVVRGLEDR